MSISMQSANQFMIFVFCVITEKDISWHNGNYETYHRPLIMISHILHSKNSTKTCFITIYSNTDNKSTDTFGHILIIFLFVYIGLRRYYECTDTCKFVICNFYRCNIMCVVLSLKYENIPSSLLYPFTFCSIPSVQ